MSQRKVLLWFVKFFIAGVIAFALLTVFSYFYFNVGAHSTSVTGSTDYRWSPHMFTSRASEGFATARTDANGFNNLSTADTVDILLMGSSHMEGFNVMQDQTTTSLLNGLLRERGLSKFAYSIAMSEHDLMHNLQNLQSAIDEFHPTNYVIIETAYVEYPIEKIRQVLLGELPRLPSTNTGLLYYLQKIPYIKLMYAQYLKLDPFGLIPPTNAAVAKEDPGLYAAELDALLSKCGSIASEAGVTLVLLYHPEIFLESDASLRALDDEAYSSVMAELCAKHGIVLLDMTPIIFAEYAAKHILPYGFSNTAVSEGHLNADGHRMIADTLNETILYREAAQP